MRQWRIAKGGTSMDDLALHDAPQPTPGAGEVLVRVRACSINFRDQAILTGKYFGGKVDRNQVPLSDGTGEITALGEGVSGLAVGDRVAGAFFMDWRDGPPNPGMGAALGAPPAPGVLQDYVVLPAHSVVPLARSLDFAQAACLPCAGVTAWNALMAGPHKAGPGRSVLVLGSGGVSVLALQIAKAAGATVIATSSSDEKLERLRALGADHTINYKQTPEWGAEAAKLSGGGVDHVVEVGGAGTLAQSIAAVGFGGEIALIGVLAGDGDTSPHGLMLKGASMRGIFVGSMAMARDLNAHIDSHAIDPVIGGRFAMEDAKAAYAHALSGDSFAKTIIEL